MGDIVKRLLISSQREVKTIAQLLSYSQNPLILSHLELIKAINSSGIYASNWLFSACTVERKTPTNPYDAVVGSEFSEK